MTHVLQAMPIVLVKQQKNKLCTPLHHAHPFFVGFVLSMTLHKVASTCCPVVFLGGCHVLLLACMLLSIWEHSFRVLHGHAFEGAVHTDIYRGNCMLDEQVWVQLPFSALAQCEGTPHIMGVVGLPWTACQLPHLFASLDARRKVWLIDPAQEVCTLCKSNALNDTCTVHLAAITEVFVVPTGTYFEIQRRAHMLVRVPRSACMALIGLATMAMCYSVKALVWDK